MTKELASLESCMFLCDPDASAEQQDFQKSQNKESFEREVNK